MPVHTCKPRAPRARPPLEWAPAPRRVLPLRAAHARASLRSPPGGARHAANTTCVCGAQCTTRAVLRQCHSGVGVCGISCQVCVGRVSTAVRACGCVPLLHAVLVQQDVGVWEVRLQRLPELLLRLLHHLALRTVPVIVTSEVASAISAAAFALFVVLDFAFHDVSAATGDRKAGRPAQLEVAPATSLASTNG